MKKSRILMKNGAPVLLAAVIASVFACPAKAEDPVTLYTASYYNFGSTAISTVYWRAVNGQKNSDTGARNFSDTGVANPGVFITGNVTNIFPDGQRGFVHGYVPNGTYNRSHIWTDLDAQTGNTATGTAKFSAINPADWTLTFSWLAYDNQNVGYTYITVKINDQWYVSIDGQGTTTVNTVQAKSVTLNPWANQWHLLNLTVAADTSETPNATLSVGSLVATALPAGNITGVGLYIAGAGLANLTSDLVYRIDNFTITGTPGAPAPPVVPEPATVAALAGCFVFAAAVLSRRLLP